MVTVASIIEIVTRQFVNASLYGCCIPASIVTHELLARNGFKSSLRKGLILMDYGGGRRMAGFHVWMEVDGQAHDISHEVTCRLVPDIRQFKSSVTTSKLPMGYLRSDMDTHAEISTLVENCNVYDSYCEDKDHFWSVAPWNIRDIRRRVFSTSMK